PLAAPMPMQVPMAPSVPAYTMVPQPSIGYGQMTYQTQVPVQQTVQNQMAPQQAPTTPPPASTPSASALQEQLRQCEQKLREMEALRDRFLREQLPPPKRCPAPGEE